MGGILIDLVLVDGNLTVVHLIHVQVLDNAVIDKILENTLAGLELLEKVHIVCFKRILRRQTR